MTVSTFIQPDNTTQTVAEYPDIIDGDIAVFHRVSGAFAPHAQAVPDMTVALDPGSVLNSNVLAEIGVQSTTTITPPVSDPRIDRIVIAQSDGTVSVVTGTEAASPTPPSLPVGAWPIAQVLLQTSTTAIDNSMIMDERNFMGGGASGRLLNVQVFTSSGTYTPTPGTNSIIVEIVGGGGSGGGTAATGANASAAAGGAGGGSYAKSRYTSGFAGVAITIGTGGAVPAAGNNNGNFGGATNFGALMNAPGGAYGYGSPAYTTPGLGGPGGSGLLSTGGNIINGRGTSGGLGFVLAMNVMTGGRGGVSHFGAGPGPTLGSAGFPGTSYGSGGNGASSGASTAARAGGAGADGVAVIYEYS
ncbi:MAG: hypothetical protein K0R63_197 [Rickettsiales bacterium]|jgi:hypothetical protein|nr:hypothetical protein [Rickettsiales bacterium]